MKRTLTGSLAGALLVLACIASSAVGAAGPQVSVRVEGKSRTLLAPTLTQTHTGWVTKGGAPTGACSATSAAGALDVATHHNWGGTYSSSLGLAVSSILGEAHTFSSPFYWSVWVNNSYAQSGVCGIKLHRGDHLLFAVEPDTGYWYPIGLSAPRTTTVGHSFEVKVVWFNVGGKSKPLAGARVAGAVTNSHGIARLVGHHDGALLLRATRSGYIRSAPARVLVTG